MLAGARVVDSNRVESGKALLGELLKRDDVIFTLLGRATSYAHAGLELRIVPEIRPASGAPENLLKIIFQGKSTGEFAGMALAFTGCDTGIAVRSTAIDANGMAWVPRRVGSFRVSVASEPSPA